ncbi:uncharacterized protein NPIL_704031 [Nephila pilipes]|uniref:Uncharacterized protein n=1 Tax=Nephila pilipes TaxID=299642 RepID=A0A8X6I6B0_NEPPI|nr:uncharacterized protein NPIL_704031 [Nephila pilipes]
MFVRDLYRIVGGKKHVPTSSFVSKGWIMAFDSDLSTFLKLTKYIRIGIGDKNDNPPYFEQASYEAEVNEDEDIQHTVITVTAKDKDEWTWYDKRLYVLKPLLLILKWRT